jgi:hypothetical protein
MLPFQLEETPPGEYVAINRPDASIKLKTPLSEVGFEHRTKIEPLV